VRTGSGSIDDDRGAEVDVVSTEVLGVAVDRAGIVGAPVDTGDGELVEPLRRLTTSPRGTPDGVAAAIGDLADAVSWCGPIGVAFPGVVEHGVVRTAHGLDPSWVGVDVPAMLLEEFGESATVVNDADAAGLAEVRHGAGFGHAGVVVVVTFATSVGTGVFHDGLLVPNTELGGLPIDGHDTEVLVAGRPGVDDVAAWDRWAVDLDRYLCLLERLLWPSLIVIGGIDRGFARIAGRLSTRTAVVPARLADEGAPVGAALYHRDRHPRPCALAT
jgi:polyphosphate glucokinase